MKYIQFVFILLILIGCKEKKNISDRTVTDHSIKSEKMTSITKTL
ncbi:hypothetical protein EZS27_035442, partial [termite gut metagenome]